jgi:hypothetical protein
MTNLDRITYRCDPDLQVLTSSVLETWPPSEHGRARDKYIVRTISVRGDGLRRHPSYIIPLTGGSMMRDIAHTFNWLYLSLTWQMTAAYALFNGHDRYGVAVSNARLRWRRLF